MNPSNLETPVVIPTVTATDLADYNKQLELALSLTGALAHIDLSLGHFSPSTMVDVERISVPDNIHPDVHLMLENNMPKLHTVVALDPRIVIVHVESDDVDESITFLSQHGVRTGVGILPETSVTSYSGLIEQADEVMIFGGHLGYKGGDIDLTQLDKVKEIRSYKPNVSISWDGGIRHDNILALKNGGVDIFYVGSAISKADDPSEAYKSLANLV